MQRSVQKTLAKKISCVGIGLHSGKKVSMSLLPAPVGSGISFVRTDIPKSPIIEASLNNVIHTKRATTLGFNGVSVSTVEHLLSALSGLGVDNVRIEIDSAEVPIMDGSSAPFVYLIKTAGLKNQPEAGRTCYVIRKQIEITDGDKYVSIAPAAEFSIDYSISFDHPLLKRQEYTFNFSSEVFEREISRARTFGFLHEVEYLKKRGFALGGSLDNAILVDRFRVLNQGGLRYDNEFVRHKILDLIGDLSLLGAPVIGSFTAYKSGHTLNNALLTKLKSSPDVWELTEGVDPSSGMEGDYRLPTLDQTDRITTTA